MTDEIAPGIRKITVERMNVTTPGGRRVHRWKIWINGHYLGLYLSRRSAISALTVRKVPHEKAQRLTE